MEHKELKADWKTNVQVKTYSLKDVKKHNTKNDLWIVIHGHVFDISKYARDHPGGFEPLMEVAGADSTSAFEDVGHSDDAREILQAYLIGVLEGHDPNDSLTTPKSKDVAGRVQVVRATVKSDEKKAQPESSIWKPEIGAIAIGFGALAWWAISDHHLLLQLSNDAQGRLIGHGGFIGGALFSFGLCGVTGGLVARYFQKATSFGQGFSSFPAHLPSSSNRISHFHPAGVLSPSEYRKYQLREKTELTDGIFAFVFNLPTKQSVLGLPIGQHVAIRGTIDEHTVVRSYTPVSNNRDLGRLELLIRVYPDGQLGNYLKSLQVGDNVEIRGPKGAMRYRKGMCKAIGMVGGGTGITPLFQIIRAVCEDETDDTQITLVYCNRSEPDILLRKRLNHYAKIAPQKFKMYLTLDNPPSGWKGGEGHVTKELLREHMPQPTADNKVFLCGPPGMVNATKKDLVDLGFSDSGPVNKMTDQIFCF